MMKRGIINARTISVGTVGIQLSTLITGRNVNFGQITCPCDLDVIRSLYEVDALINTLKSLVEQCAVLAYLHSTVRNQTSTVSILHTPRNFNSLSNR